FYRRWNEFDPKHVGIACEEVKTNDGVECAPDATQKKHDPRTVYRYDTRKNGNRNTGHPFGSTLSEDEKTALLEYLKTICAPWRGGGTRPSRPSTARAAQPRARPRERRSPIFRASLRRMTTASPRS